MPRRPVSRRARPLLPAALLIAALAPLSPALAQNGGAQPPAQAAGEAAAPADPAARAPDAPDLNRPARPAVTLPLPALSLPEGIELAEGGWRLTGPAAQGQPGAAVRSSLAEMARWTAAETTGRVTVLAQVAGPEQDTSIARRDSLSHGLAIRAALEKGGLPVTRIDVRPLGRTAEARDAVLVLPPATAQPAPRQNQGPSRR